MGNVRRPIPLSAFDRLLAWNRTYEAGRPHQAFGYKTTDQLYHNWLDTYAAERKVLSDIS